METKHTKEYANKLAVEYQKKYGGYIDDFYLGYMAAVKETSAPDLLDALVELRSKIQYEQGFNKLNQQGKDWSKELSLINNAIKKATE